MYTLLKRTHLHTLMCMRMRIRVHTDTHQEEALARMDTILSSLLLTSSQLDECLEKGALKGACSI